MTVVRSLPRPSTLLLAALLIALYVSSPAPMAVTVAVVVWGLHTPPALVAGIVLTLGWKALHPKRVAR
jgi:hypothetical protein